MVAGTCDVVNFLLWGQPGASAIVGLWGITMVINVQRFTFYRGVGFIEHVGPTTSMFFSTRVAGTISGVGNFYHVFFIRKLWVNWAIAMFNGASKCYNGAFNV